MEYRSEVDGLRALSVILIILFHCNVYIFKGGFVGVDIFFVISGYLISSIILKELNEKKFSIFNFYERRIRRIIPCLFLVLVVSLPISLYYFYDQELKEFSNILLSILFFIPNIIFYLNTSYFEDLESFNFLLHTWSLGVEEQFYIFLPFFLIYIYKFNKNLILTIIILLILLNIILVQFGGNLNISYPYINDNFQFFNQSNYFSFYLLTSRIWEFFFGVILSFLFKYNLKINKFKSNLLALFGLILIFFSGFYFNSLTPFPSIFSVLPVFGTFLIILFSKGTLVGSILSINILKFIGKLSFSLYLWHNPISFIINKELDIENNFILFLLVFSISLLLSYFSWKFIENTFRDKKKISLKILIIYLLIMSSIVLIFCLVFKNTNKFAFNQLSEESINFLENYKGNLMAQEYRKNSCLRYDNENIIDESCFKISNNKKNLIIWGDSVANSLSFGLRKKFASEFNILETTSASCITNIKLENYGSICYENNKKFLELIKTKKINTVVFSVFDRIEKIKFNEISVFLKENKVKEIIFIGPNLNWQPNLPEYIARNNIDTKNTERIEVKKIFFKQNKIIKKKLKKYSNIKNINIIDELCDGTKCKYLIPNSKKNDNLILYDDNHYSLSGSIFIADLL